MEFQSVYFVPVVLAAVIVVQFCTNIDAISTYNATKSVNDDGKLAKSELLKRLRREATPGNGNVLLDEMIPTWKTWLVENGYEPYYAEYYQKKLESLVLTVRGCTISGLTTFQRTGDVTLELEEDISLTADVGIDDVSVICNDVEIKTSFINFAGQLYARIKEFRIEGTIRQKSGKANLSGLKIINEADITLDFTGKGFIGTILGYIGNGYLNYKVKQILNNVDQLTKFTNEVLGGIDIESVIVNNFK